MNKKQAAIILAAGKGTRMKSSKPKVMHKIAGLPMISHVLNGCEAADIDAIYCVVNNEMDINSVVAPHETLVQQEQHGTADAVKSARETLKNFDGLVFILNGDGPFISAETLKKLQDKATESGLALLGFEANNPYGYGRLVIQNNYLTEIVEEKDCTDAQRLISLCNGGVYCVDGKKLFGWLDKITNDNVQGEYYLTDIVKVAISDGVKPAFHMTSEHELFSINSRPQLAQAETIMQNRLRENAMNNGVTMIDPSTVYLSTDTKFGQDITIEPNVFIGTGVRIGDNTHIHANSYIEGAEIGENSEIGPFARIRPKSKIGNNVCVGNFIEVNRSEFKDGSKSKHLSYIGDAIIGEGTNVGAGTVFANYDGFNKHVSTTGKNTFIGSNSTIISPVKIGDGAFVAAGSVITTDIDDDALAIGRNKEIMRQGWANHYREKHKKGE